MTEIIFITQEVRDKRADWKALERKRDADGLEWEPAVANARRDFIAAAEAAKPAQQEKDF